MTNYLAENGRRIKIIEQLSVNNSVHFLGVPDQCGGSGLPFICNLQAPVEATGLVSVNNSNHNWRGSIFDAYSMTNFTWGSSGKPRPDYLPRSPVNPHAT